MKCTLPVATLEQARGRRLSFTLDTERTGDFFLRGADVVFAAAVAVTVELDDDRLYVVRELCARWIQPLPYVEGQTLEECWRVNGWEKLCLDEFWSKEGPTAMFHALVAAATPRLVVADEVRTHVHLLEAMAAAYGCSYAWYVDCIAVDAWWLNWLMLAADELAGLDGYLSPHFKPAQRTSPASA